MYFEYWAPVLFCVLVTLAAGIGFCIIFGGKSREAVTSLQHIIGRADKQKRCSIQNTASLETRISKAGSPALKELWDRYKADSDNLFGGEYAPEPAVYFTYRDLFEIPAHEKLQSILQLLFPAFAVLSVIAPLTLLFFSGAEITPERLRACIGTASAGVLIIVAAYIAAFVYIRTVQQKNNGVLLRFNQMLTLQLPVINQSTQAALLLRANRENTEAFKATAKAIADKIDDFAVNGVTPLVTQAFTKSIEKHITPGIHELEKTLTELSATVVRQQEVGMRELAAAFAGSLNNSLVQQIKAMTADMAVLNAGLNDFNQKTQAQIGSMLDTFTANGQVLREAAEISRAVAAHQEAAERSIGDMSTALSRTEQLMDRLNARDAEIFSVIRANYDKLFVLQQQLDTQLKAAEATSGTTLEAIRGVSATMSESVQTLIASTSESGARTYTMIGEKLTEVLGATTASNTEATAAIGSAVQTLIASTNETSEQTYSRISEKLSAVLDATNASNTESAAAIGSAVRLLIASTNDMSEQTYSRISEKLTAALAETTAAFDSTGSAIRNSSELLLSGIGDTVNADFERIFARLSELLAATNTSNAETYANISTAVEHLTSTVGDTVGEVFSRYSGRLMETLDETVTTNKETSQKLSSTMASLALAGTEQYEKAAQAAAQLLDNVVIEMNRAMDGVGHEIADSIREASLGSAEIVSRLAEKTAQLKEEYDTYFNRVETQSLQNLGEIDYRMQNIFARFSNDATDVMDRLENNISKAVGLFEGNTTTLLQSMEEQSRSIGLYAKELNIDVASLTGTLRESVGVFTEQLQDSTRKTFEAFDDGLAEVSARLANTVESIRESVENLPAVIRPDQKAER